MSHGGFRDMSAGKTDANFRRTRHFKKPTMQVIPKNVVRQSLLACALLSASIAACGAQTGLGLDHSAFLTLNARLPDSLAEMATAPAHDNSAAAATVDEGVEDARSGYRWDGPPATEPDWRGIKRDTVYYIGYQFAAIGVLYVAPEDVSGWSEEDKEDYSFEKWKDNVGDPVWDEDKWWINYILHPYWGGAFYIRAQERGFDQVQSFLYSALLSTLYEFGAEAMFEPPSYQDLIVTPVVGALVGQFVFAPLREHIRAQPGEPGWAGKAVLFLTDPMGVVNVATDRLFGVKADLSLRLTALPESSDLPGGRRESLDGLHGDASGSDDSPVWGLQLRAQW